MMIAKIKAALRDFVTEFGKTSLHNDKAAVLGRQRLSRSDS